MSNKKQRQPTKPPIKKKFFLRYYKMFSKKWIDVSRIFSMALVIRDFREGTGTIHSHTHSLDLELKMGK